MRIIVDAFGGDHAPLEIIKGCAQAVAEYGVEILAVGNESVIREVAQKNQIPLDHISITNVEKVMPVEVDATEVVKSYDDSTLAVGLKMLANGEGDAYVSAGSTGADCLFHVFVDDLAGAVGVGRRDVDGVAAA